jgi:hypothetical protein
LVSTPGEQLIIWNKRNGKPTIAENGDIKFSILEKENDYEINIQTNRNETEISVAGNRSLHF